ncbi:hypothetical protein HN51_062646 [Arachis hypogaea]
MFALVFVVFDVETVFLYPWTIGFDILGISVFIEALIVVLFLIVGSVYAWRKGDMICCHTLVSIINAWTEMLLGLHLLAP